MCVEVGEFVHVRIAALMLKRSTNPQAAVGEVCLQKAAYETAKANDDLETALNIKKKVRVVARTWEASTRGGVDAVGRWAGATNIW